MRLKPLLLYMDYLLFSCHFEIVCFGHICIYNVSCPSLFFVFSQSWCLYFSSLPSFSLWLWLSCLRRNQSIWHMRESALPLNRPGCCSWMQQPPFWNKLTQCRWPDLLPSCTYPFYWSTCEPSSFRNASTCCSVDLLLPPPVETWSDVTEDHPAFLYLS